MEYLMCITYDGSKFYGFQRQKNKTSIQGEIEVVLSKILNREVFIKGVSRTDRGVHAYNSYVSFENDKELDVDKLKHSINSMINESIYIKTIECVSEDFDIRRDVIEKEYVYKISTLGFNPLEKDYILQYGKKLDLKLLKKCAKKIKGTHDFKSFTSDKDKSDYIRTINYIKIINYNGYFFIFISAKGFLRYMIRNIIGLMLEINEGKKTLNDIDKIFESRDRTKNAKCTDGCGLYLNSVRFKKGL